MTYQITSIHSYPIKSMAAIDHNEARATEYGFAYDRYWMLVDKQNQFITQRDIPELCLFQPKLNPNSLAITYKEKSLEIPLILEHDKQEVRSKVWGSPVIGYAENKEICQWFSEQLNQEIRLIRSQTQNPRLAKKHKDAKIHFPDGHQYAIIGQASMDNLNSKIGNTLNVDRFRANIIFSGGDPHDEDLWKRIKIGENIFERTKSISRCTVTCIDQSTAEKGKEPLRTLAGYRKGYFKKILFGSYYKLVEKTNYNIAVDQEILLYTA